MITRMVTYDFLLQQYDGFLHGYLNEEWSTFVGVVATPIGGERSSAQHAWSRTGANDFEIDNVQEISPD